MPHFAIESGTEWCAWFWVQILAGVADQIKNFAVLYLVDISEVPDFNTMYELYDPCTIMFFFRNKVRPPVYYQCIA
jgi:hypothetical protein